MVLQPAEPSQEASVVIPISGDPITEVWGSRALKATIF
jgi:hypothetical protein